MPRPASGLRGDLPGVARVEMSTRTRILALLSSVLLFSVAASGFAFYTLVRADDELHRVAGHDVPLLKVVTEITAAQLEQSIRFERALRFARDREGSPQARSRYDGAKGEFEDLASSIWNSFQDGRGIAERAAAQGDDARTRQEATAVLALLKHIDARHNAYAEQVRAVFSSLDSGRWTNARALADRIEGDEDQLQQALGRLLVEVSSSTEGASLRAQANEERALWVTGVFAGLAILLSALVFVHVVWLVSEIKSLGGLLPICSHCKKIRDDRGYWNQLEAYLEAHSEAAFTHGICADCQEQLHAEVAARRTHEAREASGAGGGPLA
jgi:hypothetical protein